MRLFRIAKKQYIEDFSGEGARLYGGRWNKKGTKMLYFSSHLSLCVLEILVHFEQNLAPKDLYFIEIEIDATLINNSEDFTGLELHIRDNPPHYTTQEFGSNWVLENTSVGLAVPSAILPMEHNILINPNHPNWQQHKIIKSGLLHLDARVIG